MLPIKEELRLDLFAQNLITKAEMIQLFDSFSAIEKEYYLEEILFLIDQSKPQEEDIITSIKESQLK